MRFFRKLFKIGAAAGTVYAAAKVTEQYKENNPDGVGDVNGDGKIDYKDKLIEAEKAAGQVFEQGRAYVKEKMPEAEAAAEKLKNAAGEIIDKISDRL